MNILVYVVFIIIIILSALSFVYTDKFLNTLKPENQPNSNENKDKRDKYSKIIQSLNWVPILIIVLAYIYHMVTNSKSN